MYLSRLLLNPRSNRVRREMEDPYQLHRTVMSAFPVNLPEHERVLFRLDTPEIGVPCLFVQSVEAPSWGVLESPDAHAYLMPTAAPNPAVATFEPTFDEGDRLLFRLRANPTVKRAGKRRGLLRREEQRLWLSHKGEQGGFRVIALRIRTEGVDSSTVHREQGKQVIKLLAVRYEGLLEVTDSDLLARTVRNGIGPAKGLGFGLLSLAIPKADA